MSTLDLYSAQGYNAPVDGIVLRTAIETWAVIVSAATGTSTNSTANFMAVTNTLSGSTYTCLRPAWCFNTATIDPLAVITAVSLFLKVRQKTFGMAGWTFNVVSSILASPSSLQSNDYNDFGITSFSSVLYVNLPAVGVYHEFSLNADGQNWINRSGYTAYGIRTNLDLDVIAPTVTNTMNFHSADATSSTDRPYLRIIYDLPGSAESGQYQIII